LPVIEAPSFEGGRSGCLVVKKGCLPEESDEEVKLMEEATSAKAGTMNGKGQMYDCWRRRTLL